MRIISPTHPPAASPSYLLIPSNSNSNSKQSIDFSPPLIAMVVIAAAAFLIVTYSRLISRHFLPPLIRQIRRYRRWRRRRRLLLLHGPSVVVDVESPHYSFDGLHVYGLDDSVIKSMPLSLFLDKNIDQFPGGGDCAVCLLEFVDKDYVRTLPLCAHSFHVDCIDVWLRSHASCPLCRAGVLPPREWSPFFSERILLDSIFLDPSPPPPPPTTRRSVSVTTVPEIVQEPMETEDNLETRRPEMLKRSYSFGFERNFSSERLVMDPATASPWRRHHRRGSFSFWRRPSPFSSLSKPRVFSFRSSRKSPFLGRRRGGGGAFVPMSESACIRYAYCYSAGGGGSKSMSMASPMFGRSSASSRMRCGDPEALISPERYGSR